MTDRYHTRRTALKTTGSLIIGGMALVGSASAHELKPGAIEPVWGDGEVWELLASEPPVEEGHVDNEGDEEAHEPFYLIKSLEDSGVRGSGHSPQASGGNHFPIGHDHVIPIPGEVDDQFNAQWHVKVVTGGGGMTDLVNQDQDGNYMTDTAVIENATNVTILETPEVFTCPARPHRDD